MTSAELCEYERLREAARAADAAFRAYEEKLAKTCEHPAKYLVTYEWEHDNGYGRQSWITGERCTICRAKDAWNIGTLRKAITTGLA